MSWSRSKSKFKAYKGGLAEELDKTFRRVLLAQCFNTGFDQLVGGAEMPVANFLTDQAFGFGGDVDVHGVGLLLLSE